MSGPATLSGTAPTKDASTGCSTCSMSFTYECLAIRVARKLKAIDVIDVLSDLFILRALPLASVQQRTGVPRQGSPGMDRGCRCQDRLHRARQRRTLADRHYHFRGHRKTAAEEIDTNAASCSASSPCMLRSVPYVGSCECAADALPPAICLVKKDCGPAFFLQNSATLLPRMRRGCTNPCRGAPLINRQKAYQRRIDPMG
jgi:hypothetical protein